jgi:hypothetical protein
MLRRACPFLLLLALMATSAACSMHEGNPYADSKRSWDSPHSAALEDKLRNRLATTQRDN